MKNTTVHATALDQPIPRKDPGALPGPHPRPYAFTYYCLGCNEAGLWASPLPSPFSLIQSHLAGARHRKRRRAQRRSADNASAT